MRAAGIISNHSAERAAAVRGRVRSERKMIFFSFISQSVQDDAGLNSGESSLGIYLEHLVHILGEVQNHRDVAALSGKTRARSAR